MNASVEDGQRLPDEPTPAPAPSKDAERRAHLKEVTLKAMDGSLPRGRELKYWEPPALAPQHIAWCFDRAAGMRNIDIAEKYNVTPERVSVILNSPDAEYLMGEILAVGADRVADPIERMKGFAHEMINVKLSIIRDAEAPKSLKNEIASDFLDRAGYGARRKVDVNVKPSITLPVEQGKRLVDALEESMKVADVDYSAYLSRRPSPERKEESESRTLSSGPEQAGASLEGLPEASPATEREREVELSLAEEDVLLRDARKKRRIA